MAVYNGKKYVKEQIDSIFSQKAACGIQLFVRDDGSGDGSAEFIGGYAKERNLDITVTKGENIGPSASFMWLVNHCPKADYYAFCDQDDVWIQGKIQQAVTHLLTEEPALWLSDYTVVDAGLSPMEECAIGRPVEDPARILFYNNVSGCTMVFNRRLLEVMRELELDDFRMHDILALDIAALYGNIYFEKKPFMLYRQHGGNAIGFSHKKIKIFKWIKEKFHMVMHRENYRIAEYAGRMLRLHSELFSDKTKQDFVCISEYKDSFFKTLALLRRDFTHNGINRTSISIRMKILLHYF